MQVEQLLCFPRKRNCKISMTIARGTFKAQATRTHDIVADVCKAAGVKPRSRTRIKIKERWLNHVECRETIIVGRRVHPVMRIVENTKWYVSRDLCAPSLVQGRFTYRVSRVATSDDVAGKCRFSGINVYPRGYGKSHRRCDREYFRRGTLLCHCKVFGELIGTGCSRID